MSKELYIKELLLLGQKKHCNYFYRVLELSLVI